MKRILQLFKSSDGQAMAEFAVVFPVQLLCTLGIIQFALVLVARDVVNYAAQAAARAELVGEDTQRAAAMICSTVTGATLGKRDVRLEPGLGTTAWEQTDTLGSSVSFPGWSEPIPGVTGRPGDDIVLPGWGKLQGSAHALLKTHTHTAIAHDDDSDFVEVQVLYEYELIIPGVNWVFSSHRIGGSPHLGIVRTARAPRNWAADSVGKEPYQHPEIPDMEDDDP
jgi:hypothetical protein